MDALKNGWSSGSHHTKQPQNKMDVLPKTCLQIILAAKGLVRHSNSSPKQQRRPLPSLLSETEYEYHIFFSQYLKLLYIWRFSQYLKLLYIWRFSQYLNLLYIWRFSQYLKLLYIWRFSAALASSVSSRHHSVLRGCCVLFGWLHTRTHTLLKCTFWTLWKAQVWRVYSCVLFGWRNTNTHTFNQGCSLKKWAC